VVKDLPETLAKAIALGDQHRETARQFVERLVADHAPGADAVVLEGPVARRLAELARKRKADEIVNRLPRVGALQRRAGQRLPRPAAAG
jgi:hypothetical protein